MLLETQVWNFTASGHPGTSHPQHMHTVGVARHWHALCAPGPPTRCECGGEGGEVLGHMH